MFAKFLPICLLVSSVVIGSSCAARGTAGKTRPPTTSKTRPSAPKPKGYPGDHCTPDETGKQCDFGQIGARDVGSGVNWYSIEKEIAIGKQLAQDVEKEAKIIDDPIISEYVNRVGQNLVRKSDAKVPFTIKVIDNDEVNAYTLPGGFFFVNSGLILLVESESELAGVMAHEIAHVTARHGVRQATRGRIIDLATIPLIFMGGWGGYGVRQAVGLLIPMTFLKFSRGFEEEADELGLQYLYNSGYDPVSFTYVFEKLMAQEKRKKGTLSKVFSSHPPNESRIIRTQKIMSFFPPRSEYAMNRSEFDEVKARLKNIVGQKKKQDEKDREGKPTLRRKGSDKIEPESKEGEKKKEDDDKPELKRKN